MLDVKTSRHHSQATSSQIAIHSQSSFRENPQWAATCRKRSAAPPASRCGSPTSPRRRSTPAATPSSPKTGKPTRAPPPPPPFFVRRRQAGRHYCEWIVNFFFADVARTHARRDKKETLAQNYRRLGLVARLRAPPGGVEKSLHDKAGNDAAAAQGGSAFAVAPSLDRAVISEARVERDADGKIVRVIRPGDGNPLHDPLADLDSDDEDEEDYEQQRPAEGGGTEVVRALEEASRNPAEPKPRHQSDGEREWLGRLVERHGEDVRAMARDAKLNPMQQTAADIKRRLKKANLLS